MTLLNLVAQLRQLDSEHTLYVKEPWAPESEAVASPPDSEERLVPEHLELQGFRYFLEVSIASEFVQGWRSTKLLPPTTLQVCKRLIQYAVNDA